MLTSVLLSPIATSPLSARDTRPDTSVAVFQDADTLYNHGVDLQNMGKFIEAIEKYSEAIAKRKTFNDAYLNRGICYLQLNEFAKAEADISYYIERKPNIALGYINRASLFIKQGDFTKAWQDVETAERLPAINPSDKQRLLLTRAKLHQQGAEYAKAVALYTTALAEKNISLTFRRSVLLQRSLTYIRWMEARLPQTGQQPDSALRRKALDDLQECRKEDSPAVEERLVRAETALAKREFALVLMETGTFVTDSSSEPLPFILRAQAYLELSPADLSGAATEIERALTKLAVQ
jgi:tetratricopeptide (TPR) repeat protein